MNRIIDVEYEVIDETVPRAKRFGTRQLVVLLVVLSMVAIFKSLPDTYGDDLTPFNETVHVANPEYGRVFNMGGGRCFHNELIKTDKGDKTVSVHYKC